MKYLKILLSKLFSFVLAVIVTVSLFTAVGCDNEIESRHVKAAQMLCFDHDGIKEMEIDPIGNDLYICMDGVQYVVGFSSDDGGTYFITHNKSDEVRNEMLDRIMFPKKWEKRDADAKEAKAEHKKLEQIMKPASAIVGDRGL